MSFFFCPLLWLITFLSVGSVGYAGDLISFPPIEHIEPRAVRNLKLSPNDEFLIVLLSDRSLRLFDLRKSEPVKLEEFPGNTFYMEKDERFEYDFSRDGNKVAVSYKQKINICTLKPEYKCDSIATLWEGKVTAISFTHEGNSIVFATSNGNMYVLDFTSMEYLHSRRISSNIHGIASLNNNSFVTISQETPMIWRFDDKYGELLSNLLLKFYSLPSEKVRTSADGETIYIEDKTTGFLTFKAASGELIGEGISYEVQPSGMTVSGDGTKISLSKFTEIYIYNAREKAKLIKKISCEHSSLHFTAEAFSQKNSDLLYLGTGDGRIFTIDITQESLLPIRSRL
jgi:WD40 repeat protein